MCKKIIFAGILGGIVFTGWTILINGIFGFQARIEMKQIPEERLVYEILKKNITEPGKYICNPELNAEGRFPDDEPVFSILYSGFHHDAAGSLMWIGLAVFFIAPLTAAWLLSHASDRILSSYFRKVLFYTVIGLLISVLTDLSGLGIGGVPVNNVLLLGAGRVAVWTLMGLVAGLILKPEPAKPKIK